MAQAKILAVANHKGGVGKVDFVHLDQAFRGRAERLDDVLQRGFRGDAAIVEVGWDAFVGGSEV